MTKKYVNRNVSTGEVIPINLVNDSVRGTPLLENNICRKC